MKYIFVSIIPLFIFSCGGGGGVYYTPKVTDSFLPLNKTKLMGRLKYKEFKFPEYDERKKQRTKAQKWSLEKLGKEYYYCQDCMFNNEKVIIVIDDYSVRILSSNKKLITELNIPRYGIFSQCCSIKFGSKEYLALYVDQQATSHSSTLFVLDTEFKVQYQEHFLGALSLGKGFSKTIGNFLVVKSEDFWFPDGLDKPMQKINGNWLYYLK